MLIKGFFTYINKTSEHSTLIWFVQEKQIVFSEYEV